MHDGDIIAGRNIAGQPINQLVHAGNFLRLGKLILLRPARNLTGEIITGLAEITQANGFVIGIVQVSQSFNFGFKNRAAAFFRNIGQLRVP